MVAEKHDALSFEAKFGGWLGLHSGQTRAQPNLDAHRYRVI